MVGPGKVDCQSNQSMELYGRDWKRLFNTKVSFAPSLS